MATKTLTRSLLMPLRDTFAALLCLLTLAAPAHGQARWRVEPKASLAWWQVAPHMDHLWATTCPEEPTWRPGEGRSVGWSPSGFTAPQRAWVLDTTIVPLYPRYWVLPVCTDAVAGNVVADDTTHWRGVRGEFVVRAAALMTGDDARDSYTREAILDTRRFPEITFRLDSLVDVSHQGDTLTGTAVGLFTLRDVAKPMTATIQAWPHAGNLRVLAKFRVPATALVPEYGLSRFALGLGVGMLIWQYLYMGVDVVLRPETGAAAR